MIMKFREPEVIYQQKKIPSHCASKSKYYEAQHSHFSDENVKDHVKVYLFMQTCDLLNPTRWRSINANKKKYYLSHECCAIDGAISPSVLFCVQFRLFAS